MNEPSGIVGLISDFGEGPYTGIMRAVLKSINPRLEIVDIDHSIPSFSITAGAYVITHSYHWLPRGSVIVAVIDPGVGTSRVALAVETENYVFIGPDNGVLYPAIVSDGIKRVVALNESKVNSLAKMRSKSPLKQHAWPISRTFHGRDLFAPAGALIASGYADLDDLGEPYSLDRIRRSTLEHVEKINGSTYRVTVVYIDKFGNVALSLRPKKIGLRLSMYRNATIKSNIANSKARIGKTFADVNPGEVIIYENSFGHLEIGVNRGSAAKKIGAEIDTKLEIQFENNIGATSGPTQGRQRQPPVIGMESDGLSDRLYW